MARAAAAKHLHLVSERGLSQQDSGSDFDAVLIESFMVALATRKHASRATQKTYRAALAHLQGFAHTHDWGSLADLSEPQLTEWFLWLKANRATQTQGVYLLAARAFYRFLVDEEERDDDPTLKLRAPRREDTINPPFTDEEVAAIFKSQDRKSLSGARNLALFRLMYDTGLRLSEALSVKVGDIDYRHGTLKVRGKGSKERLVRCSTTARRDIHRWVNLRKKEGLPESEWLFPGQIPTTHLSANRAGIIHQELGKQLGIDIRAHRWRHSHAQELLDAGANLDEVRVVLGHASLQTLGPYIRATEASRALKAQEQLSQKKGR